MKIGLYHKLPPCGFLNNLERLLYFSILTFLLFSVVHASFPEILQDIDGNEINLKNLAAQKTVAIITMKAPDCPVCQTQILRLMENFAKLAACNVTFLVLAPGPVEKLKQTREMTQFPFPFILDENLEIALSFGLLLSETEILPSILILDKDLDIAWSQKGRNAFYFGDPALMKQINCKGWI